MNQHVDPTISLAALLAPLVGAVMAAELAPHLVVVFSGLFGSCISLMTWRKCTRTEGLAYLLLMTAGAWFFAPLLASVAATIWTPLRDLPHADQAAAVIFGWVGYRWETLAKAALGRAKKLIASGDKP